MKQSLLYVLLAATVALHGNVLADEPRQTGLTPQQLEQIQSIGRNILMAKRHVPKFAEAEAIRASVEDIRKSLGELTAPRTSDIRLTPIQQGSGSTSSQAAADPNAQWRQERAVQFTRLRANLGRLQTQKAAYASRHQAQDMSWYQRLQNWISGGSVQQRHESTVKPMTDAALERLNNLQAEIDAAIALPAVERHRQLAQIAQGLRIHKGPERAATVSNDGSQDVASRRDTPTLITRTTHRREF